MPALAPSKASGEDGVDGVAAGVGKVIAAHAVVFLEVADDGLDGGPPFEFALDLRREAALLAARVDLELVIGWGVVAAIARKSPSKGQKPTNSIT